MPAISEQDMNAMLAEESRVRPSKYFPKIKKTNLVVEFMLDGYLCNQNMSAIPEILLECLENVKLSHVRI